MAKKAANTHGIKPRPVTEAEKAAIGPHLIEYSESQRRTTVAHENIKFLVEKFAGKGLILDIVDNDWSFVATPITPGPQIVETAPESE